PGDGAGAGRAAPPPGDEQGDRHAGRRARGVARPAVPARDAAGLRRRRPGADAVRVRGEQSLRDEAVLARGALLIGAGGAERLRRAQRAAVGDPAAGPAGPGGPLAAGQGLRGHGGAARAGGDAAPDGAGGPGRRALPHGVAAALPHPAGGAARAGAGAAARMRTIAHVSDLHFGREDPRVVEAVLEDLAASRPHLVVVSGDLTQRARRREFQAARAFLDRLPSPALVVPGNHDIPLFDLARRFFRPLERYKRFVTDDLSPLFHDEDLAVLGVNTARSNVWKNGRVSHAQIETIRAHFAPLPQRMTKVLVTHHPFLAPPGTAGHRLVGRGLQALQAAEACGVDLLLAGHLHVGFTGDVRAHYLTI